ncbi:MAG: aminoglycoside 6-adenylyltransferase [Chloroflexota bacterium]
MELTKIRTQIKEKIVEAARSDLRVVGCLDYGSSSEGRGDKWSDLDIALFIQDANLEQFNQEWESWAADLGPLLLAYIGGIGKPWAVYDASPVPLRVDFNFHPQSHIDQILTWPNAPVSLDKMVLYDDTSGRLSQIVSKIVGQSLAPDDLERWFHSICGDLWVYLLRTHTKLMRGEQWTARHDFNFVIMGNLMALLRIECGAVDRMRAESAAARIESVLSPARLQQLNNTIPGSSKEDLSRSLQLAAILGADVCRQIAATHQWTWPSDLAKKTISAVRKSS